MSIDVDGLFIKADYAEGVEWVWVPGPFVYSVAELEKVLGELVDRNDQESST